MEELSLIIQYGWKLLLCASITMAHSHGRQPEFHIVDLDTQSQALFAAKTKCQPKTGDRQRVNGTFCSDYFDEIICWQNVKAGQTAVLPCPNYINGFSTSGFASRKCLLNGKWFTDPVTNRTYSNYTQCLRRHSANGEILFVKHIPKIQLMSNIGYGVSLVSLVTAIFIMVYFRRLHCPRNTMHINLFVSFVIRAAVNFAKDRLFVEGVGLTEDISREPNGSIFFLQNSSHWKCKLLFSAFQYSLSANYLWIFLEGLYLHLVLTAVVKDSRGVTKYVIIGWVTPLTIVIPWVMVRLFLEDELCWNTHPTAGYSWIIKGPIIASIIINFFFFVNIVRLLCSKLKYAATPEKRRLRNSKLTKSTLVLIPLFGVHYMVFVGLPAGMTNNEIAELVKLYYEIFFSSFQGFIVAALYCFISTEVKNELRRKYQRYRITKKARAKSCFGRSSSSIRSHSPHRRHSNSGLTNSCDGEWLYNKTNNDKRYLHAQPLPFKHIERYRNPHGIRSSSRKQLRLK